ncbi:SnoaL-like domain-containing protein [Lentzea waywayandensis]|uniref:SnoaL-like domain-containing protein n=1 Tax=Lentzea waywayandensis TaxID=84724 RepID=A0A1I6FJ30_9PSEU|nr:nuclear transport factor 2 family protein [Lentzea waywayandensis]SFR29940.1 SnoaL-like domain-containing protein [Lentzea waywayandensis]
MTEERKIQNVLALYVRATDRRDGKGQGALFTDDAIVRILCKTGPDEYKPFGEPLIGGDAVAYAVDNFMEPHPPGGSSHHLTGDHIIDVNGDEAHLNAQFVVFQTRAAERPADGWPEGARGAQGEVKPIESGYYDTDLRKVNGKWKIVGHRVLLDMPMAAG